MGIRERMARREAEDLAKRQAVEEKKRERAMNCGTPLTVGMLYRAIANSRAYIQGGNGVSAFYVDVKVLLKNLEDEAYTDD